jgi:quercetin dioxygenase-like cupin family protein
MKTEKELNEKIIALTMQIRERYPELSKFLNEMPITIPNESSPEINIKILEEYNESVSNMLKKYELPHMNTMTTVSEVLNILKERGYTVDFNLKENHLLYNNSMKLSPGEFVVDKHYRFEGLSDPADEAIVYAISSAKGNIKGTLVNGYGIYSESVTNEMLQALKENQHSIDIKNKTNIMEEKFNESTPQRPDGDRLMDATMVTIDLPAFLQQIKQEAKWKDSDRNALTVYKTNGMRIVLIALHAGAEMVKHTANGIISLQILEGEIKFSTDEHTVELSKGQVLALHKQIPHSVLAKEESVFLLTLTTTLEEIK